MWFPRIPLFMDAFLIIPEEQVLGIKIQTFEITDFFSGDDKNF
jgi:hypothetical protein